MELLTKICTKCGAIFRTDDELSRHGKFHMPGEKKRKTDLNANSRSCCFY